MVMEVQGMKLAPLAFIVMAGCAVPGDLPQDARKALLIADAALSVVECAADPACGPE